MSSKTTKSSTNSAYKRKLAKVTPTKRTVKTVGGVVGNRLGYSLGGLAGSYVGGYLGRRVGQGFNKITGRGDYYSGSSLMPPTSYPAHFKNAGKDIVVSRSEFLCDISSGAGTPSAFNLQSFLVNPGLQYSRGGAFSWLCNIAANFQEYSIEQMIFEYRPTSGNSTGANTALGTIVMCANYQSTDANYTSKAAMLDSQWAISGEPSSKILFPVECAPSDKQFKMYDIRTGPILSTQNQDLFDFCNFQIASVGCPTASQILGELHVTYTVRLSKYQTSPVGNLISNAHYTIYNSALTATATNTQVLGTNTWPMVARTNNQMALTFDYTASASRIIFPPTLSQGTYLVRLTWKGTSTVLNLSTAPTFTNCAALSPGPILSPLDSQVNYSTNSTMTAGVAFFNFYFQVTAQNAVITFSSETLPTTVYSVDLSIHEVNPLCFYTGLP